MDQSVSVLRSFGIKEELIPYSFIEFIQSFMKKIRLNVTPDADILTEKAPSKVVIFVPGLSANRNLYTVFTSNLASRGYVVFTTDHIEQVNLTPQ